MAEKWLAGERLFNATPGKALAVGMLAVALTWNKITVVFCGFTAFSLWYAMVMELCLFSKKSVSRWEKALMPVGVLSYSIYLWHQPLLAQMLHGMRQLGLPQTPGASLAVLPVVLVLVVALGFISYRLLELPSIALGKHIKLPRLSGIPATGGKPLNLPAAAPINP